MLEKIQDSNNAKCRATRQLEMLHIMLTYPEAYNYLSFVDIPIIPFEPGAGNRNNNNVEDSVNYCTGIHG